MWCLQSLRRFLPSDSFLKASRFIRPRSCHEFLETRHASCSRLVSFGIAGAVSVRGRGRRPLYALRTPRSPHALLQAWCRSNHGGHGSLGTGGVESAYPPLCKKERHTQLVVRYMTSLEDRAPLAALSSPLSPLTPLSPYAMACIRRECYASPKLAVTRMGSNTTNSCGHQMLYIGLFLTNEDASHCLQQCPCSVVHSTATIDNDQCRTCCRSTMSRSLSSHQKRGAGVRCSFLESVVPSSPLATPTYVARALPR